MHGPNCVQVGRKGGHDEEEEGEPQRLTWLKSGHSAWTGQCQALCLRGRAGALQQAVPCHPRARRRHPIAGAANNPWTPEWIRTVFGMLDALEPSLVRRSLQHALHARLVREVEDHAVCLQRRGEEDEHIGHATAISRTAGCSLAIAPPRRSGRPHLETQISGQAAKILALLGVGVAAVHYHVDAGLQGRPCDDHALMTSARLPSTRDGVLGAEDRRVSACQTRMGARRCSDQGMRAGALLSHLVDTRPPKLASGDQAFSKRALARSLDTYHDQHYGKARGAQQRTGLDACIPFGHYEPH